MIIHFSKKTGLLNQFFASVAILAVLGSGGVRVYRCAQPSIEHINQIMAQKEAENAQKKAEKRKIEEENDRAQYNDNDPKLLTQVMDSGKSGTFYVYSEITTNKPVSIDGVEGDYVWVIRFTVDNSSPVVEDDLSWFEDDGNVLATKVVSSSTINFCGQEISFSKKLELFSSHNSTDFIRHLKTTVINKELSYVYFGIPADGSIKGSANIIVKEGKIEEVDELEVGQTMEDVRNQKHNKYNGFSDFSYYIRNR